MDPDVFAQDGRTWAKVGVISKPLYSRPDKVILSLACNHFLVIQKGETRVGDYHYCPACTKGG